MKARDFDVVDVPPDFADLFRIDARGRKLFNLNLEPVKSRRAR